MPCSNHYRIVPEESLARVWTHGRVDREIKLAEIAALRSDAAWHEDMSVIWDCRQVTEVVFVPEDLSPILEALLDYANGMDVFYGDNDDVYVIAKLFATLERRRGKLARVCITLDNVLEVLGRTELPPELRDPAGDDQQQRQTA